jgi:hypothetical protein
LGRKKAVTDLFEQVGDIAVTGQGDAMNEAQVEQVDARLINWGRWAASERHRRGRCLSVEHRYLPPRLAEDETAAQRTPMPLNVPDAELVESAVVALRCRPTRRFLVNYYVKRWARQTVCREHGITEDMFLGYRARVCELVAESLREREDLLIRRGKPLWAGVARIARGRV